MNVYRLTKKALAWRPAPYDWRAEGAMAKTPEADPAPEVAKPPAAGKVNGTPITLPIAKPEKRQRPKPPVTKPADDHPWVHPPAVLPSVPKEAPITRPLPAHLETKPDPRHSPASPDPGALDMDADDLAAIALPEAPIAPAFGTGAFLLANQPFEASSQPWVDNSSHSENPNNSAATLTQANQPEIPDSSSAPEASCQGSLDDSIHSAMQKDMQNNHVMQNNHALLPGESHEDELPAQPKITPAAISGCGGNGECGHCANHAAAGELEELAEAQVARLTAQLNDAQSALADAIADLAVSQRERDLLHQRLRDQARHEPAMMADCLMELLRLALLRIPHPDHYAGVGKMVGSEDRP